MEGIIPIESKQENLVTTATLDSTDLLPLGHKLMKTEHESPTIHTGKRKRLDEQLIKVQNIVNKMVTVDKIVNEFYALDIKMRKELDESVQHMYNHISQMNQSFEQQWKTSQQRNKFNHHDESSYEELLRQMNQINQQMLQHQSSTLQLDEKDEKLLEDAKTTRQTTPKLCSPSPEREKQQKHRTNTTGTLTASANKTLTTRTLGVQTSTDTMEQLVPYHHNIKPQKQTDSKESLLEQQQHVTLQLVLLDNMIQTETVSFVDQQRTNRFVSVEPALRPE